MKEKIKPQIQFFGFYATLTFNILTRKILFLCFLIFLQIAHSQESQKNATVKTKNDSTKVDELIATAQNEAKTNYENNTLIRKQKVYFNEIETEINKAKIILKQGIGYRSFTNELNTLKQFQKSAFDDIVSQKNADITLRNITTTSRLLNELVNRTNLQIQTIENDANALTNIQRKLDSLTIDKDLYKYPVNDSISKAIYFRKLEYIHNDLSYLNTHIKNSLDSIQDLELDAKTLKFDVQKKIIEYNAKRKNIFASFDQPKNNTVNTTMGVALITSFIKDSILLMFYWSNHFEYILFTILLIFAVYVYLKSLKKKYLKTDKLEGSKNLILIFEKPFAVSTIISITIFQFFLPVPPYIFISIIWLLLALAINAIHKKIRNGHRSNLWKGIVFLNTICVFDVLILYKSKSEVILVYFLIFSTIAFAGYIYYFRKKIHDLYLLKISYIVVIFEVIALVLMLNNNYNFGKISMSIGIFTYLIWKQFYYTSNFIKDILRYSNFLNDTENNYKIDNLYHKHFTLTKTDKVLFILGWVYITIRNNDLLKSIIDPITEIIYEEKTFGDITFSYYSLFLFILILVIASLTSKVISFLGTEVKTNKNTPIKNSGLGSWVLLIRITIITTGILIAFLSTGIPVDKIVIIISALSVGIGFGLQSIINNLVSGLIIAFEKPINHQDIVEINGQIGKMKSIGIRSSVITTWDGADVIIPNGDLLNQHLVNWTLGNTKRRCEIFIGVAYGTDLQKTKEILNTILHENELVLKFPSPIIWITEFNESSIDLVIKYWVPHFNYKDEVKSDIMFKIDEQFKLNDITIPFPQREIHILNEEKNSPEKNLNK